MSNLIQRAKSRIGGLGLMAASVVVLAGSSFGVAHAIGTPVMDPSAIAQITKTLGVEAQQLQRAVEGVQELNKMATSVGKAGPGAAGSMFADVGLDFHRQAKPLKELEGSMPRLLDALPQSQAGRALGVSAGVASNAKTSIDSGRQFVNQAFYARSNTAGALAQRNQAREAAVRDAASSGFALSVVQKNRVANMEPVMKGLADKASKATDLRGDVAANTAVMMAMLEGQAHQNAMLASLVEMEAVKAINEDRR